MSSEALIRVYGDSLSMPRYMDGIPWNETYVEIIERKLSKTCRTRIYNRSQGGADIVSLFERYIADCSYFGPGGKLIIQVGIVDCAPRPIPQWMRLLIGKLPASLRNRIVALLHRNRATILKITRGGWQKTSGKRFLNTFRRWLDHGVTEFDKIYVINIAPTTKDIDIHSPGLQKAIVTFNDLIRQACLATNCNRVVLLDAHATLIGSQRGLESYVNPTDGHHLTVLGHKVYSDLILGGLGVFECE